MTNSNHSETNISTIVDIGASGFPNHSFGYKKSQNEKIYLFDPHPEYYSDLKNRYGHLDNFHIYDIALSNTKGTLDFYITGKGNCSSLLEPDKDHPIVQSRTNLNQYNKVQVQVDTLDNILGHLPQIDYLKLDTQGNEYEIFEGAINTLSKVKYIKCEVEFTPVYTNQKLAGDIVEFLKEFNFKHERTLDIRPTHADYIFVNQNML